MSVFNIRGDWSKTYSFFHKLQKIDIESILERYAKEGVDVLSAATPKLTGETSSLWGYEISKKRKIITITWTNDNINDGVNIALILQYGHGTKNGGYVEGIDYINPALKPILEKMADALWNEVIGNG